MSALEQTFHFQCKALKLNPETEYKFHPERKWRFDFAFPDRMVAVEIEGGVWSNGRHTRGSGYVADMEKYNEAARLGWFVFRFSGNEVNNGSAIKFIDSLLRKKKAGE